MKASPLALGAGLLIFVSLVVWRMWPAEPGSEAPARPVSRREVVQFGGPTMGTVFMVKVVNTGMTEGDPDRITMAVREALDEVDNKMSTYEPDSELMVFNRHTGSDVFPLSPETLEVFDLAQRAHSESGGAFDVTVQPLVEAWGFGKSDREAPPADTEIEVLRRQVGSEHLEVVMAAGGVRKKKPEISADLSAIAKGYGADRAAAAIERLGFARYMVEVGGEVRTRGLNAGGRPWQIAIEHPTARGRDVYKVIGMSDAAMATSGDYRNFYEHEGVRYSHTIDPRTGRPVTHDLASVTVIAERCAWADAMATALLVLGPQDGPKLATDQGLAALFLIHAEGGLEEIATSEMEPYLK